MLEIFRCADIFVFPSFQEGLPLALLEAMASGLPVVCSNIRGSNDLMTPINTSTLCKGGIMIEKADDITAYANALTKLIQMPDHLIDMGQTNSKQAQNFSSKLVTEKMQTIYQRIL